MDHHIDLRLVPESLDSLSFIMNSLFGRLHLSLSKAGKGEIGVSFPDFNKRELGKVLRLHGKKPALVRFMELEWLRGFSDYIEASSIIAVPSNCQYRVVKRVQAKTSPQRLYRRSVKNGKITSEEAEAKIREYNITFLELPFVKIKSRSSGQFFKLFIHHGEIVSQEKIGKFSDYGLSSDATVPWF